MPILTTLGGGDENDPYNVIFAHDVDSTTSPFCDDVTMTSSTCREPEISTTENDEVDDADDVDSDVPKKRGPKKQPMTKARLAKVKVRRVKANARERSRMHGLNDALDRLRAHVPCGSRSTHQHPHHENHQQQQQKLSKIETLRLARNYIAALADILATGMRPDHVTFARALTGGLSQNTVNLIAACMHLNPRQLVTHDGSSGPYRYAFWSPDSFKQPLPLRGHYYRQLPPHSAFVDEVGSRSKAVNYGREMAVAFPGEAAVSVTGSELSDEFHDCCGVPVVPPSQRATSLPVNAHQPRRLDFRQSSLPDCDLNDSGYDGGLLTLSDIEFDTDDSSESTSSVSFFTSRPVAFY